MAKEKKLDCVILGLLSHEELTGYEIKRRMDTTLHYFWGASYGSIYPTLNELVKRGLAIKRAVGDNNRNKHLYTITSEGRAHLKNWLTLPAEQDELRYETLLKLFFGNEQGTKQAIVHIDAFAQRAEMELSKLNKAAAVLKQHLDEDPSHQYYLLTVDFGMKTYHTYLDWCREARQRLSEMEEDVC